MSGNKESMENLKKHKFFNPDNNILKNGYRTRARDNYFKITFFKIKDNRIEDENSNFDGKTIQEYKESLNTQEDSLGQILNFKKYYNRYDNHHIRIPDILITFAIVGTFFIVLGLTTTMGIVGSGLGAAFLLPAVALGVYLLGIIAIDMKNRMSRQNELKECLSIIENKEKNLLTQDISKELKSKINDPFFDYLAESCFNIEHTDDQQKIINILQNSAIIAGNLNIKSKSLKGIVNWQSEICDKILQSEMTVAQIVQCIKSLKLTENFIKNNYDIIDKNSQDNIKMLLSIKEASEIMKDLATYRDDFTKISGISEHEKYLNDNKENIISEGLEEWGKHQSSMIDKFNNTELQTWFKENESFADSFKKTTMKNINLKNILNKIEKQINKFKLLHKNEKNLTVETTRTPQEKDMAKIISKKESLLTHYEEHMTIINYLNDEHHNTTPPSTSQRLD